MTHLLNVCTEMCFSKGWSKHICRANIRYNSYKTVKGLILHSSVYVGLLLE